MNKYSHAAIDKANIKNINAFIKSMTLDTIILLPAIILLIIGCFGILNSRSLINSLFSLDVIDTATISIFVLIAATSGSQTPILSAAKRYADYSDPYPQAIILTAIVIGFATQALLCTIALRLSRTTPLLKYTDLER